MEGFELEVGEGLSCIVSLSLASGQEYRIETTFLLLRAKQTDWSQEWEHSRIRGASGYWAVWGGQNN